MSSSTQRPPDSNRTPPESPADTPDTVDEELCDSLAIHHVFKALGEIDVSVTVTDHCEKLATLVYHTAHEFFDAAHAERCRLMFENAVQKAGNIPDEAKAAGAEVLVALTKAQDNELDEKGGA